LPVEKRIFSFFFSVMSGALYSWLPLLSVDFVLLPRQFGEDRFFNEVVVPLFMHHAKGPHPSLQSQSDSDIALSGHFF